MSNRSLARSMSVVLAGALALGVSSCLFSHDAAHEQTLAVKADPDYTHAQSRSAQQVYQPEFYEGTTAPEAPAPLAEQRAKAPSAAHVWIAGQHERRGGEWVWVSGRYALPPRADVVWVPGHWVGHLNGYVWLEGGWR